MYLILVAGSRNGSQDISKISFNIGTLENCTKTNIPCCPLGVFIFVKLMANWKQASAAAFLTSSEGKSNSLKTST